MKTSVKIPGLDPVNKKLLILCSSTGLLIAILLLTWYFQSLIPPFLVSSPQSRSVVRFDPKVPQEISPNDYLSGKGIPDSQVKVFLTKGKVTEIKTDQSGNWSLQISSAFQNGVYRLTVMILDKADQITDIRSYKLNIVSKSWFEKFNLNSLFSFKPAKAQENKPMAQFPEGEWVGQMISLGIFPVIENGEVVLISKEQFQYFYNDDIITCKRGCLTTLEPIGNIIKEARSDQTLLSSLVTKLKDNGYQPSVLDSYFPEVTDLIKQGVVRDFYPTSVRQPITKSEIDEQILIQYIYAVVQESRRQKHFWSNPDELTKLLIEKTDPIFGINSLIKWVTLKPNQVTDEERLNALFGLTIIYGLAEKSIGITAKTVLDFPQMIKDAGVIRRSVSAGEIIPLSIADARATRGWVPISRWSNFLESSFNATRTRNLYPRLPRALPYESNYLQYYIYPLINSRKAFVLDPDIVRPLLEEQISKLSHLMQSKLKGKVSGNDLKQVLDQNWVVVVEDSAHERLVEGARAFAHGRLVVIRGSLLEELGQTSFKHTIFHEYVHVINSIYRKIPTIGKYFEYNQEQADNYGRLMSIFYEIATDDIVRVYFSLEGNYGLKYPQLTASFRSLIQRLIDKSGGRVSWSDFAEFALTGDDGELLFKLLSYRSPDKMTPEEFVKIVQEEVDTQKLNRILQDVNWTKQKESIERTEKALKIGAAGGGAVLISTVFAAAASGEELPSDVTIIYPSLEFSEDLNILKDQALGNYTITINSINGLLQPGGIIQPSAFISQEGMNIDAAKFTSIWKLTTEDSMNVLASCQNSCQIRVPIDLEPGNYKLMVYLTRIGEDQILATDLYPFVVEVSQAPTIKSITINEETISPENLDKIISVQLRDTSEAQSIPIVVNYSDKTSRFLALTFNYQPAQSGSSITPTEAGQPYQICTPGTYDTKCSGNCGGCNTDAGEQFYRQCNAEGIDWGEWQSQCSIECEGVCSVAPASEAEPVEEESCDDLYYFDTAYDTCVHKYSGDPYPNCNYVFDSVERSLCPE